MSDQTSVIGYRGTCAGLQVGDLIEPTGSIEDDPIGIEAIYD